MRHDRCMQCPTADLARNRHNEVATRTDDTSRTGRLGAIRDTTGVHTIGLPQAFARRNLRLPLLMGAGSSMVPFQDPSSLTQEPSSGFHVPGSSPSLVHSLGENTCQSPFSQHLHCAHTRGGAHVFRPSNNSATHDITRVFEESILWYLPLNVPSHRYVIDPL